ncbi:FAD-dependent oxidoreductase [Cognatishimia sp. D5M38]|uniref:FAD-dependent oxidoreductase n=1 Tax=Cognatishimia coralii TaxID=3083254 RepID=A0ABU8QKZ5_9RHOB
MIYGTVIIGSSPAMLLEAILRAQQGHGPTIVIEAKDQLGGNWSPQTRFGHQIDNGPHLLYNFNSDMSELFATLTEITGCSFEEMAPPPRSESRLNPAMLEFSFGFHGSKTRKRLRAIRAVLARHWLPVLKPQKYWRPQGGLSNIVRQFHLKLEALGVEIRTSVAVQSLRELPNGTVEVSLDNGEHIIGESVKATAASLPLLAGVSSSFTLPELKSRRYGQAYIYLRNARKNVFSFFRCFHDPQMFLAAELGSSAQPPLPEGCTVLSVNLTSGSLADEINNSEILDFLRRKKLVEGINGSPEIHCVEWEVIDLPIVTNEITNQLNTELDSIEFIHCHNLVRTLYSRLELAGALN